MFEVLTRSGHRFRYEGSEYYEFGEAGLSPDKVDTTVVRVLRGSEDGDIELVHTINYVVRVGEVSSGDCLEFMREHAMGKCSRCGHIENLPEIPDIAK